MYYKITTFRRQAATKSAFGSAHQISSQNSPPNRPPMQVPTTTSLKKCRLRYRRDHPSIGNNTRKIIPAVMLKWRINRLTKAWNVMCIDALMTLLIYKAQISNAQARVTARRSEYCWLVSHITPVTTINRMVIVVNQRCRCTRSETSIFVYLPLRTPRKVRIVTGRNTPPMIRPLNRAARMKGSWENKSVTTNTGIVTNGWQANDMKVASDFFKGFNSDLYIYP